MLSLCGDRRDNCVFKPLGSLVKIYIDVSTCGGAEFAGVDVLSAARRVARGDDPIKVVVDPRRGCMRDHRTETNNTIKISMDKVMS